ncbi:iron-hydroxamate ABC transporter substrate-binding protein [Paenibacillus dendritiformis]|uniref:iron-hydroxamate ABC transporter substrate-binding protein n=1 Tax=Paenibacillus dendritiformis TaxID=130049 RepID=UPI00248B6EA1|nr:iron-hydroxamate ABC transporter substrate-binding protein [Paenibacillus dendritiformis]WGU95845.1 iron-hydroxamate ABC transporter substrate-binding protein [Paenibacillus dendritiformis]
MGGWKSAKGCVIGLALITMVLMLAACGSIQGGAKEGSGGTEAQASQAGSGSPAEAAKTRVVKTGKGEIEIPANPQRIVAQGYLATFLALGVKPVGAPSWDIESPHVRHLTSGIQDIGTIDASSVEKILSLGPDLIVTLSDDPAIYEQLSKIAPTVVFHYNTFDDTRDEIRTFGEMLGKEKEAEAWIADFNATVQTAKNKIKGIVAEGETVSVMGGFNKEIFVYSFGIWRGVQAVYEHLELTPPPAVQKLIDHREDIKFISLEKVPEYAGDYIFLDSGHDGQFERNGAFWNSLDAVKNNRVFDLDGDYFWPYDPIAIKAQVEKVAEMLVERQQSLSGP